MINQVPNFNRGNSDAFSDFKKQDNAYYLNTHFLEEQKQKKDKSFGTTLAISAMVVGFGLLALMKGALPKTAIKYLDKWKISMEQKLAKGGKFQDFYRFMLKGVNSTLEKSQSINNLTSLKDLLFQRLMWGKNGQRTFTRRIHEGITKIFGKISRKTVNTAYGSTQNKFASLTDSFKQINERLLASNPNNKELAAKIDDITSRITRVNSNLDAGFGINARSKRADEIMKATDGLFDYCWQESFGDVGKMTSKKMWTTFIADDYLMPHKMKMANDVGFLRQAITHDINDSYKAATKALANIDKLAAPSDRVTNGVISNIRIKLDKYNKLSGKNEMSERLKLNSEIITDLKKLAGSFSEEATNFGYDKTTIDAISKYVSNVEEIISKSSKGELQEILSLYKQILPRNEYLKLRAQVNGAVKSLDKAIDTETVQYFDKVRDLKTGSAPTDIVSILGTVGAVGWYLGKADNKDEKISASLKYGIPAVGAIATSLYSTARLVSGGKSLALGLLSGWVMNQIGSIIDNARKKYSVDVSLHNKLKDIKKSQLESV